MKSYAIHLRQVWSLGSCSPSIALDRLKSAAAPLGNMKLLTAVIKVMKPLAASVAEIPGPEPFRTLLTS